MSVQNNTILMFLTIMFVLALIITPTAAFAACDFQPDQPDCPCFDSNGVWDPAGAFIQDVAIQTVGTRNSCRCPGTPGCTWPFADPNENYPGKPYYQMILGCNSEESALVSAWLLWVLEALGPVPDIYQRMAWCSETISYWHRETGIPYPGGYRTDWHISWQNYSVGQLKTWYMTEEGSRGGRGRWIEPQDVNYVDFELGVTVPVPGAYVAWQRYCADRKRWLGRSHSLMIKEMWVHEDAHGKVFRVEVSLLEGNSGYKVKDTRRWDDVLSLTPQGPDWIPTDKKIYGFGIDLDSTGQPIYDASRLHVVPWPLVVAPPLITIVEPNDPVWEHYVPYIPKCIAYAKLMHTMGEPNVTCSPPGLQISGIPDGRTTQWYFPKGLPGGAEIDIDLWDVHPLPIKGIELRWAHSSFPRDYRVQYAASTPPQYQDAYVPRLPDPIQIPPGSSIPVPAIFATTGNGVDVRYVKLTFPSTFQQDAILQELRFDYYQGPLQDTEECQFTLGGDLDGNCRVDFFDVAMMAGNWLVDCVVNPDDPACVPQ